MSINEPTDMEPNFFGYADAALACSISQAVHLNDKNTLQRILNKRKKKPLPLSADNRKWTALHLAASQPETKECLEMLLRYGDSVLIDLNAETFQGETALHIACKHNCEENVLILLRKGCDPKKKTLEGSSPLHIAAWKGLDRIIDHLLDRRVNLNDQDWQGYTPLHLAAMHGHLKVCRVLLENGASARLVDSDGNLPLHLACQNGHFDAVRLLLEREPALVNQPNCRGVTPPMLAAQNHDVGGVRYLLENGAKTEARDKDQKIALQFAAAGGNADVLRLVLRSTDATSIERCCLLNFAHVLDAADGTFHSLTCCAIDSGRVDCLAALLDSRLPRSVLEAPYAENSGCSLDVYTPLAYLFSVHVDEASPPNDGAFDARLRLLLRHGVTSLREFAAAVEFAWPERRLLFADPFAVLFGGRWPRAQQLRYFDMLLAHGVTVDYCVRCYRRDDDDRPFAEFAADYGRYCRPALDAVRRGDVDTVRLLVSNSALLEPDALCDHLIMSCTSGTIGDFLRGLRETCAMYRYLTALKPAYHDDTLRRRDPANFKRFPYASLAHFFPRSDEFAGATLQQLCRTAVRRLVRGRTLRDNLRHFHANVAALPLPAALKDYLLFKC